MEVWSQPQANSLRDPVSKKLIAKKGWQSGSSSKSACRTSVRPQVQTPVLPKKKKRHQVNLISESKFINAVHYEVSLRISYKQDCPEGMSVGILQVTLPFPYG
jgi:hypothetical protein